MADETGLHLATTRTAMRRLGFHLRLDDEIFFSLNQTAHFLKTQKIISSLPNFGTCATTAYAGLSRAE